MHSSLTVSDMVYKTKQFPFMIRKRLISLVSHIFLYECGLLKDLSLQVKQTCYMVGSYIIYMTKIMTCLSSANFYGVSARQKSCLFGLYCQRICNKGFPSTLLSHKQIFFMERKREGERKEVLN